MSVEIKMNLTDSMADRIVISTEPTDINGNYTMFVPSFVATYFQIQLRAHNEKKEKVECRECDWLLILTGNEELRDVQDAYVAHIEEKHRPPKKEEPQKFYVDEDKRVWMRVGTPTWSVHNCNAKAHIKCLEEAERTKDASGYGTVFVGDFPKESDPELALSVSQMKELFDNLVMEGFTEAQATRIVGIVAHG